MKKDKDYIKISKDFSMSPGARYRKDGTKSGEEFYEDILKPKYKKIVIEDKNTLTLDMDDTFGFPSSFLSEVFGRLVKDFGEDSIKKIMIISTEDDSLIDYIRNLIKDYE